MPGQRSLVRSPDFPMDWNRSAKAQNHRVASSFIHSLKAGPEELKPETQKWFSPAYCIVLPHHRVVNSKTVHSAGLITFRPEPCQPNAIRPVEVNPWRGYEGIRACFRRGRVLYAGAVSCNASGAWSPRRFLGNDLRPRKTRKSDRLMNDGR